MKNSLDGIMIRFANFLLVNLDTVKETSNLLEGEGATEFISDWMQANWELLVELPLRNMAGFERAFLEPYGEGADCNYKSSRVWLPDSLPTHRVVCRSRNGNHVRDTLTGNILNIGNGAINFDHFAAKSKSGWHEQAQPFDCIVGYLNEQEVLIRIEEIVFGVEKLE